jgi:putative colanic acid biosynthesis acetyltransferase WcaF
VAADAFVGPGVTVGERSVVGARASVFKDVPPDVIVGGNPARVMKPRVLSE